jgi:hypothetical protein
MPFNPAPEYASKFKVKSKPGSVEFQVGDIRWRRRFTVDLQRFADEALANRFRHIWRVSINCQFELLCLIHRAPNVRTVVVRSWPKAFDHLNDLAPEANVPSQKLSPT